MPERSDEDAVGIARIDSEVGNLLRVSQADVRPGFTGIGGLVNAVARGEVRPVQAFPATDVQNRWIGGGDDNDADGPRRLVVEDRRPGTTGIGRLPDASVHLRHIERVRVAAMARDRDRAARPVRPNVSPAKFGEQGGLSGRRLRRRGCGLQMAKGRNHETRRQGAGAKRHVSSSHLGSRFNKAEALRNQGRSRRCK